MNRKPTPLAIVSLVIVLCLVAVAYSQPDGYAEVSALRSASFDRVGCLRFGNGVVTEEMLTAAKQDKSCDGSKPLFDVDLKKQTLIAYSVGSDCHMRVATRVFRSDRDRKYKLIVNVFYGGCRAGGWRQGWVLIDKVPDGYAVEVVDVRVDRHNVKPADQFRFPNPPSIKTNEPVDTREVDMKGCLPTTGQSQWIISTPGHLENALGRVEADRDRCREHIKSLNLHFERDTLVHYAFASGHCSRPPGLSIETRMQVSTDPRENRYLMNIGYDDAGENYCKVWTTYPLWVVVRKLPEGFGIDFVATANSRRKADNERLESRSINLKGCIQTIFTKRFVIRDKAAYLKAIRNDAGRESCLKTLEEIDFDKHSLVGAELNTGYCRFPTGLQYHAEKDEAQKQYVFKVRWATGGYCRAVSEYDLWLLVPRLPADYGVVFDLGTDMKP